MRQTILFNSYMFVFVFVFLPVVLAVYCQVLKHAERTWTIAWLVLASLAYDVWSKQDEDEHYQRPAPSIAWARKTTGSAVRAQFRFKRVASVFSPVPLSHV